jgi:hypothetical protein
LTAPEIPLLAEPREASRNADQVLLSDTNFNNLTRTHSPLLAEAGLCDIGRPSNEGHGQSAFPQGDY